jgi:hypothetical protein
MPDGIVIDANVINDFYKEYLVKNGFVYNLINWIIGNIGIATNQHIHAEWKNTCSADLFLTWLTDQIKLKKIKNVECGNIDKNIKKKMAQIYGFPVNTRDFQYVKCAYYTDSTKYIMTYNYHFFEPICESQSTQAKNRAREQRMGSFCKFLLKELGIRVGMPSHCKTDFNVP